MPSLLPKKVSFFDQSFEVSHDCKNPETTTPDTSSEEANTAEDLFCKTEDSRRLDLEEEAKELLSSCVDRYYSREFLLVNREIQKISPEVPCRLTGKELKKMNMDPPGLRLWGLPEGYFVNMNLQVQKVRVRRLWKPTRQRAKKLRFDDDTMVKETCQKLRGVLNKVTPTTKAFFINEFISLNLSSNDQLLSRSVKLILHKVLTDHLYCSLYVEMIAALVESEFEKFGKSPFEEKLMYRFEEILEGQMVFSGNIELEKKKKMTKKRFQKVKIVTFLGQLYRYKIFSSTWIWDFLQQIFHSFSKWKINNDRIRSGLHLLLVVADELAKEIAHSELKNLLSELIDMSDSLSIKNRLKLSDLVNMRIHHWRPGLMKHSEPKTIDEFRKETQKRVGRVNVQRVMTLRRMGSSGSSKTESESKSNDVRKSGLTKTGGWFQKD